MQTDTREKIEIEIEIEIERWMQTVT